MKKTLCLIWFIVALIMTFAGECPAWDKDQPAASLSLRTSNQLILANFSDIQDGFGADHDFDGSTQTGHHTWLHFDEQAAFPGAGDPAANHGLLGGILADGKTELGWEDEDQNQLQITKAGGLYSSKTLEVTGESTFNNHINMGAGDDIIGSTSTGITIGTNAFVVADDDSGDTDIAGTLEATGLTTVADGSLTKTTAAPSTDAMIANKKYVDDYANSKGWNNDGTTVFNTTFTGVDTFQDLDLSTYVGSTYALVYLEVTAGGAGKFAAKPKGYGGAATAHYLSSTGGSAYLGSSLVSKFGYITVATNSSGVIEIASDNGATTFTVKLVGFIGINP